MSQVSSALKGRVIGFLLCPVRREDSQAGLLRIARAPRARRMVWPDVTGTV